jgi:hypothetical protein
LTINDLFKEVHYGMSDKYRGDYYREKFDILGVHEAADVWSDWSGTELVSGSNEE